MRRLLGAVLLFVLVAGPNASLALAEAPAPGPRPESPEPSVAPSPWSGDTALTVPAGRIEFGLFHQLHWGVTDDVELAAHPALFFLMPHVEAKVLWYRGEPFYIASRHRLSYPTILLGLLATEGAGGLLPADTDVPQALIIDTDLLATLAFADSHFATLEAGLSVAPRGSGDMPLLDFPYLYPRFSVLDTTANVRAGGGIEGQVGEHFAYGLDLDFWWLPAVSGGYAVEHGLNLTWRFSDDHALTGGYRLSHARYPAGNQVHWLPYVDVLLGF